MGNGHRAISYRIARNFQYVWNITSLPKNIKTLNETATNSMHCGYLGIRRLNLITSLGYEKLWEILRGRIICFKLKWRRISLAVYKENQRGSKKNGWKVSAALGPTVPDTEFQQEREHRWSTHPQSWQDMEDDFCSESEKGKSQYYLWDLILNHLERHVSFNASICFKMFTIIFLPD